MWWCCFCGDGEESEAHREILDENNGQCISVEPVTSSVVTTSKTSKDVCIPRNDTLRTQTEITTSERKNSFTGVTDNRKTVVDYMLPESYATPVGNERYYSADFKRWLKGDNIYIQPTYNSSNDVLKSMETAVADCNNPYQEFELFASWKKEAAANQTTIPNTHSSSVVNSELSYAQILRTNPNRRDLKNTESRPHTASYSSMASSRIGKSSQPQHTGSPVARVTPQCKQIHTEAVPPVILSKRQSNAVERNVKGSDKYLNKIDVIKCTDGGYIINRVVHLSAKSWHGILELDPDTVCLLCSVIYYDKHIYEENHLSRLQWSTNRILAKGSNVVRELIEDTLYHCGICNIVVGNKLKIDVHVYSEEHRKKYFASRDTCRKILARAFINRELR